MQEFKVWAYFRVAQFDFLHAFLAVLVAQFDFLYASFAASLEDLQEHYKFIVAVHKTEIFIQQMFQNVGVIQMFNHNSLKTWSSDSGFSYSS